jgi:hypothetical protein
MKQAVNMKKMNDTIKNAAAFLIAGLLFFSCTFGGTEDYGTLLVMLPDGGSNTAARSVSGGFTATLRYRLDFSGPGGVLTEYFNSGGSAAVSLIPGNWTVTLGVLNAAGETIGSSGPVTAAITAGKTTSIEIPVVIDKDRKDIASFAITSPVSAQGVINPDTNTIKVYVPAGTSTASMNFTLIHTGASVNHSSETPLNFGSSQTFTVTAEDSTTKSYTVSVVYIAWPGTWADYDLSGLAQSAGTTVVALEEDDIVFGLFQHDLSVTLKNISSAAYDSLLTGITGFGTPTVSYNLGGIRMDKFEKPNGLYTIRVRLDMDTQNDQITIRADKRLLSAIFPPDWW